jgi:hypothetical protein
MNLLRAYVFLIVLVKIFYFFFILRSIHLRYKLKYNPNDKNDKASLQISDHLKHQIELIFTMLVAILLIIIFNPINKKIIIDSETRTILYIFGILLIITADWGSFLSY